MMHSIALAVLLILASQPALASQTVCTFESGKSSPYYELEFIGYSDANPMIVFSSTAFGSGKRVTLQPADYTLQHFNSSLAAVLLEFRNPGNHALPPSFTLSGRSGRAKLKIGATAVGGTLHCDPHEKTSAPSLHP